MTNTEKKVLRGWIALASVAACLFVTVTAGVAASLDEKEAVESAREALDSFSGFPWYDTEKDTLQRFDVRPPADLEARRSKWEARQVNWTMPDWIGYLLKAIGWLLAGLALAFLIYALVRAIIEVGWNSPHRSDAADDQPLHGDIDRVEALPFQLQKPQGDLLSTARSFFETGDYRQAMIYLYSYQLVQLDRHQFIRLARGKTNRQYLRELRGHPVLIDILRQSMIAFEDAFFGRHEITRSRCESCWNRLDEFHREMDPVSV